jgi:hypothetical protein
MKYIDFSTILFEALQVAGQDRHSISQQTFSQFRDFSNGRLRYVYETYEWPDLVRVVAISPTKVDGITSCAIPTDANQILHVYVNNPLSTTVNKELTFRIYDNGTEKRLVFLTEPESGYLEYKVERPKLTGLSWDSSITYSIGSQIYFDSGSNTGTYTSVAGKPHYGNFYNCTNYTNVGESPATTPGKWEKVNLPYFLTSYLPRATLSDWLRSEMQFDVAQIAEQEAEFILAEEIAKITKTQGQVERLNFHNTY